MLTERPPVAWVAHISGRRQIQVLALFNLPPPGSDLIRADLTWLSAVCRAGSVDETRADVANQNEHHIVTSKNATS